VRQEEKKRAQEASLALIAEARARKAADAEERRLIDEAQRAAKQQRKEENLRAQREMYQKSMQERQSLEVTVGCDQLMASLQGQIQTFASQAGEVVKVTAISFAGGDVTFAVKFKEPQGTQTCLNMTLPTLQLSVPLTVKPPVLPVCFLHFELPEVDVNSPELIPELQTLFSEFGTVVHARVVPPRTAVIHFQDPETAARVVSQESQRTFYLLGQALSGFAVGKPAQKRKRG